MTLQQLLSLVIVSALVVACSADGSDAGNDDSSDAWGGELDVSHQQDAAPNDVDLADGLDGSAPDSGLDVELDDSGTDVSPGLDSGSDTGSSTDADGGPGTDSPWELPVEDDELVACGPWWSDCGGVCRDTLVNEEACGVCGVRCAADEVCDQGTCANVAPVARTCSDEELAELLEPATRESPSVRLTCSPVLSESDIVTKSIRLQGPGASGVIIDCQGGTLSRTQASGGPDTVQILSERLETTPASWERPTDIIIRNCRVEGSIRVLGQGLNGEGEDVRLDSLSPGHRARAQQDAPTRVLLDNLTIVGAGRIPLYLAPGTTRTTIRNSVFLGRSTKVWIYLDAESAHNRIVQNRFAGELDGDFPREQIAVDGSAGNLIAQNVFEGVTNGGVFVYRNCGEGGTIRHQEPRRNIIAGNVFIHVGAHLLNHSVWIGSRNQTHFLLDFCDLDDGYDFGSSASNLDFAGENVVVDNTFVDGGGLVANDTPTWTAGNEAFASDTGIVSPLPSPCVVFRELALPSSSATETSGRRKS